ncbi:MAG: isochorismatase family protein [Thaumarchaeota archaeon]|nr:isochorismatase family protein [Nitrososphaerota archaeon]
MLESKSSRRPYGFGDRPCLLLVDLYRMAFGEKPEPILDAIKTTPSSCGLAGWNSLPHIKTLLSASREAGIPIIFSTGLEEADCGVPAWVDRGRKLNARRDWLKESNPGFSTRYDIVDELKPLPDEVVIRKTSPSVFGGTPLLPHLISLGIDTIIACGESTSGCIRATVVDGRAFSYLMIVVEECVFDRTEASHAMNLFDMNEKYADVLPLSNVLQYLKKFRRKEKVGA